MRPAAGRRWIVTHRGKAINTQPTPPDCAPLPVIVIGAGVAGLSAALHLAERGLAPWVFEADPRLPNASGGPEWLVLRHEGRTNICFADGHARSLKKDEVPSLRWNPSSEVTRSAP